MGDDMSYDYDDDRSFFSGSTTGHASMHGPSMHGRTPLPLSLGGGSSAFPPSTSKSLSLSLCHTIRITMCLYRYWFVSSSSNALYAAVASSTTSKYLSYAATTTTYAHWYAHLSPSYQWTYWWR